MLTVVERVLASALPGRVSPAEWTWFTNAQAVAGNGPAPQLLNAYARAATQLGRAPLALDSRDLAALQGAAPGVGFDRWTTVDAGRALLLLARRNGGYAAAFVADAAACFEQGDAGEQQSFLRAIALWPEAGAFLALAIDSCRTNIIPVFEALACENPYPARHFPDRNFNQMVLKAMFNGIALARIVGLAPRLNGELSRMARDYAAERSAAGRSVPPDIHLAIHSEK